MTGFLLPAEQPVADFGNGVSPYTTLHGQAKKRVGFFVGKRVMGFR